MNTISLGIRPVATSTSLRDKSLRCGAGNHDASPSFPPDTYHAKPAGLFRAKVALSSFAMPLSIKEDWTHRI